jgi:hypothetical protein
MADIGVGSYINPVSDFDTVFYYRKGTDSHISADADVVANRRGSMDIDIMELSVHLMMDFLICICRNG